MSDALSEVTQLLLLNEGILSRRRKQKDGCWHVHVTGLSAKVYLEKIGFGLERKTKALKKYVNNRKHFWRECWDDEVVSLEVGTCDVHDISVTETHRYVANGFVNHNSYWHTKMMTSDILTDAEAIDYSDHNSGTLYTPPGGYNPYKIGLEIWRDIENRWNKGQFGKDWNDCKDPEERKRWNTGAGLGREKMFEVRKTHNDITFLDTFLTEDFCRERGFFTTIFDPSSRQWVLDSREFEDIKARLLQMMATRGTPQIYVVDANAYNRGELKLQHEYEGIDIQLEWAEQALGNLARIWGRTVHLQTLIEYKKTILSHDGTKFLSRDA